MAVIQISKIQVRRGLQENLPNLASGEFGWSIDERRLFIGNGTLTEGAPQLGVTEILTQYSDLDNLIANITASNLSFNTTTILNNATQQTNITVGNLKQRIIDYDLVRGSFTRVGSMKVTNIGGVSQLEDDYVETGNTGVILTFAANTSNASNVSLQYVSTNTGTNATFNYYLKSFQVEA